MYQPLPEITKKRERERKKKEDELVYPKKKRRRRRRRRRRRSITLICSPLTGFATKKPWNILNRMF
jgi:hypothetical protein